MRENVGGEGAPPRDEAIASPAGVPTAPIRLLVVDDEPALTRALTRWLAPYGFAVTTLHDPIEAIDYLERHPDEFQVVVLDVNMPAMSGLEVLERIRLLETPTPVVMWTADARAITATIAMRAGAFSYTTKPVTRHDEFAALLTSAASFSTLERHNRQLERQLARTDRRHFIGDTATMAALGQRVAKLGASDVSVLILGESGTGKELVARAIHDHSSRRDRPFVAVNFGALPESLIDSELFGHSRGAFTGAVGARAGVFVEADGGTLFLDEIGEMPMAVQARLLRVLQEREIRPLGGQGVREVDVRVIAATHVDLPEAVEDRRFRADLFYRLNVVTVTVPPLRERMADLPILAAHFLDKHGGGRHLQISDDAMAALLSYGWPGNVRELENALLHALALCSGDVIDQASLPRLLTLVHPGLAGQPGRRPSPTQPSLPDDLEWAADLSLAEAKKRSQDDFERRYVTRSLERAHGNITEAARVAGLDRSNFRRVLTRLGIDATRYRNGDG